MTSLLLLTWGLRYFWKRKNTLKRVCWSRTLRLILLTLCVGVSRWFHLHFTLMFWLRYYKMVQSLYKKLTPGWTWGTWRILIWALENLKNFLFNGLPLTKVYNAWAKKVQESYIWWHWILMQNMKETDFCFQKWHEEFGKFSTDSLERLSWDFDGILLPKVENAWA